MRGRSSWPLLGALLGAVLASACGEDRARGSTDETAFAKLATTMEIASCEVHVVTVGTQSGPDVLLLHGAAFHAGVRDPAGGTSLASTSTRPPQSPYGLSVP